MVFTAPAWVAAASHPDLQYARLDVMKSGGKIDEISLGFSDGPILGVRVLGRNSAHSDVVLDHSSLSRQHVAIVHSSEGLLKVIDLNSRNGTTVDGSAVDPNLPTVLREGCKLRLGASSRVYICRLTALRNGMMPPATKMPSFSKSNVGSMGPSSARRDIEVGPRLASAASATSPFEEDAALRAQMPTSFGKKLKSQPSANTSAILETHRSNLRAEREREIAAMTASMLAGPAAFPSSSSDLKKRDMDEVEGEDDVCVGFEYGYIDHNNESSGRDPRLARLPITHEVVLSGHTKMVGCVALDPAGSRVITGSHDCTIRLWDFAGMNKNHNSFRELTPQDGNAVVALSFSPGGGYFVCATASANARMYNREGVIGHRTVRGDQYIHDMTHTKGHVSALTSTMWHPTDRSLFVTGATDGTCRIWDVEGKCTLLDNELICRDVLKTRDRRNVRSSVTACCFSPSGDRVAAACIDGSLQIWNVRARQNYSRPNMIARPAHINGTETSGICFSPDCNLIASRGGDDTLLLWDSRKLKEPIKRCIGLDNAESQTSVIFSPDGAVLATPTSTRKGKGAGELVFFDVKSGDVDSLCRTAVSIGASAVCAVWHPRIDQIVVGCADNSAHVLYNPDISINGAKLSSVKSVKKRDASSYSVAEMVGDSSTPNAVGEIISVNALPMYRTETVRDAKRKMRDRKDPIKSKRPALPPNGPRAGQGTLTAPKNTFTEHFMRTHMDEIRGMKDARTKDPRDALLAHAEAASKDGFWVGNAYKATQPKTIFSKKTKEQEDAEAEKLKRDLGAYKKKTEK